jgi:hypothetical protein
VVAFVDDGLGEGVSDAGDGGESEPDGVAAGGFWVGFEGGVGRLVLISARWTVTPWRRASATRDWGE